MPIRETKGEKIMLVLTGTASFALASSRMVSFQCSSHRLREQLDSLYREAERTHTRANNTRLRLMRLSEAAEKLRSQATVEVQAGNETAARDLLLQKKKVMQALKKSMNRIEVLDQLLTKLSEAISVKETQLIGNVAADIGVHKGDSVSPIRIVSPKKVVEEPKEDEQFNPTSIGREVAEECESISDQQSVMNIPNQQMDAHKFQNMDTWEEVTNNFQVISSYEKFLVHIHRKLNDLESEVSAFLRLTTAVMEDEEKLKNPKVKTLMELLAALSDTRERLVHSFKIRKQSR